MTSDKTSTIPRSARAPNANDPITALREVGGPLVGRVPTDRVTASLGRAATCDVVVDRSFVSTVHCYLERRPAGLRVTNNSKNGTWLGGADLPAFELRAGEVFRVGETELLATTASMQDAEPDLRRLLGATDDAQICRALRLGARAPSILLTGEPGCGQADLAELLHSFSPRRPRRLEIVASLDDLRHVFSPEHDLLSLGGIYLDLARASRIKAHAPELARSIGDVVNGGTVGVYIACENAAQVQTELGFAIGPDSHLAIPSLRQRATEVPALLEHLLGADVMEKLGDANRKALLKNRWRGNLTELRDACHKLRLVVEAGGNLRAAARASDYDHTTLARAMRKLGLSFD